MILGGVVGGVVLISLLAGLVFWFLRRKRNRVAPSTLVNLNGDGLPAWAQMRYASPGSSPPIATPKLYVRISDSIALSCAVIHFLSRTPPTLQLSPPLQPRVLRCTRHRVMYR